MGYRWQSGHSCTESGCFFSYGSRTPSSSADCCVGGTCRRLRVTFGSVACRKGYTFAGHILIQVFLRVLFCGKRCLHCWWHFLKGADPGDRIRFGSPQWSLILFGLVTASIGFFLWHRLGAYFGFAGRGGKVHPLATVASLTSLTVLVLAELIFSGK